MTIDRGATLMTPTLVSQYDWTAATVTVIVRYARFPALSLAVIVITFFFSRRGIVAVHVDVPVARPEPPRLLDHETETTRALSVAVPPRTSDLVFTVKLVADVGDVIATTGGLLSSTIDQVKVFEVDKTPSVTVAFTVFVPAVFGIPEMRPVVALKARPAGRPVARYERGVPSGSVPTSCSVTDCPTTLV